MCTLTEPANGFPVPEWLTEHARRFYASGAPPVAPRIAATVVLLRPAARSGFEVYVLRRAASMSFASGMYAFPGGSVDPRDADAALSWLGPSDVDWAARLGLPPAQAQAVVCAAVREVFEESGVLLAAVDENAVEQPHGAAWEADRQALVSREQSLSEVFARRTLALRGDLLMPWARWITPEFEPRRFDTYFFLALLPPGQQARDVSGEADHTMWIRPADALARLAEGQIAMLPPTIVTLRELGGYPDVTSALAAAAGRDAATPVIPRIDGDRLVIDPSADDQRQAQPNRPVM